MTGKTHITVGIASTLPLLSLYPEFAFLGILGAVTPDLDLVLRIKHRTITHSLIALFLTTITVITFNFSIGVIFGVNYLIHLFLDSFTKTGVPLFYPFSKKYYGFKLIKSGGIIDLVVCLLAIFLIFMLLSKSFLKLTT